MVKFKLGADTDSFFHLIPPLTARMTDHPAPETLTLQDLDPIGLILDKLRLLLENLPNQLPSKPVNGPDASRYASLVNFQPDDGLLELTGSRAGALNMHLEHIFGHAAISTGASAKRPTGLWQLPL